MEVKLRNRSRLMLFVSLMAFLLLVYAYAQLEWGMPRGYGKVSVESRGSILARDGTVLAQTVGEKRIYPQGTLGGQLLGMMGTDRGLEGLEAAYDERLGQGEDITLTIDPRFQAVAESVLARAVKDRDAAYGSVLALDARTGEILVAASYPSFDPNNWRDYEGAARRNRPVLDVFEPGSTVKGLVVGAAINEGYTSPNTRYSTPMSRKIGYRVGKDRLAFRAIRDAVAHPPLLTTKEVLRYSSNVGMSHIVEHFRPEHMYGYLYDFGFGQPVDLPVVFTETGQLRPWKNWDDYVKATNAIGQGMSSTLLQLGAAFNVVANDGKYMTPRLVQGDVSRQEREVLRPETAKTLRDMLKAVVDEGIPHAAGIPGYSLAGKTGTAQVVENGRYSSTLYNSVFAGFFPAESPRVTMVVMVHGAKREYHGSQLAAPIYRDIAAEVFSQWAYPPQKPKSE